MLRDLHIESALAVLKVPDAPIPVSPVSTDSAGARETVYTSSEFFTVRKWDVSGHHVAPVDAPYLLVGVLEGSGTVNGEPVSRGDHFVVTALADGLDVEGRVTLMVTSAS
jgi:mannose-6-phosphate isomerase